MWNIMWNMLKKFFIKTLKNTAYVVAPIFTFLPESFFKDYVIIDIQPLLFDNPDTTNILINRLLVIIAIFISVFILMLLCLKFKKTCSIENSIYNYSITIERGDIFKQSNCKIVIAFDECFTTKIGNDIGDIKPDSICGQYLKLHPDLDIKDLIKKSGIKPVGTSKYKDQPKYKIGTILQNDDDLLLAFTRLNKQGRGKLTRNEYIDCLNLLWEEIEQYTDSNKKDICMPILGSGITVFEDGYISQQELLDIIIWSYKLSIHKTGARLRILYRDTDGFSVNNIDGC